MARIHRGFAVLAHTLNCTPCSFFKGYKFGVLAHKLFVFLKRSGQYSSDVMSIPFNLGIRTGKMKLEMEGRQVERCYETMFIPSPLSFSFACFLRCGILCIKDAIPRTATLYATSVKYGCSFHPLYWLAFAILSLHTSTGKPRWFQRISLALSACLWMHGYVYVGMGVCVCVDLCVCARVSLSHSKYFA